jgi:hypothetical protein
MENVRHESVSERTENILREASAAITAASERFDMGFWIRTPYRRGVACVHTVRIHRKDCGTTLCLAGWIVALAPEGEAEERSMEAIPFAAKAIAGLSFHQGERLFQTEKWPHPFQRKYRNGHNLRDSNAMAEALAERVEHFIATGG